MKTDTIIIWGKGILAAFIGGGATSASSWMGMAGAKAAGFDVPTLNFKALGIIFVSAGIFHALTYLAKSPIPGVDAAEGSAPTSPQDRSIK